MDFKMKLVSIKTKNIYKILPIFITKRYLNSEVILFYFFFFFKVTTVYDQMQIHNHIKILLKINFSGDGIVIFITNLSVAFINIKRT